MKLKNKIEKIILEYDGAQGGFTQDLLVDILAAIKEWGEEMVGENTVGDQLNNMLRAEQRARMQSSLKDKEGR